MLTAASALLLSGCAKETGNGFDAVLSFSADTPELVEVKAAAVTSVSDFYAMGYAGTTQWFPTSGGPQRVQISGGSATFSTYRWKTNESKTFFAYSNNLPTGATATIANSGVTLTYTAIPTEASAQNDVTLGRYSGNGDNGDNKGTAAMTFYHPLAQVVFKMGDMVGVSTIDNIEIAGVYSAGTTSLTTSTETGGTPSVANFSWTGTGGSAMVSQTVNSLPAKNSEIGVPFMLIPQSLATQNVTVSVTVTTTGGSSATLTKELNSGSFSTGKKTVCTLTVNPARELGCNLAAYTANNDDDIFPIGLMPIKLPGVFQIDTKGTKVSFSRGNLWCDFDNRKWYIEDMQAISEARPLSYNSSHVTHFIFDGPSTLNREEADKSYFGAEQFPNEHWDDCDEWTGSSYIRGTWGSDYFTIENGEGLNWFCLNADEWTYVINNYSTLVGYVNNIKGVFIFPSGFQWESYYGEQPNFMPEGNLTFYTISGRNWRNMENNGVVFLPQNGLRRPNGDSDSEGTTGYHLRDGHNDDGYYLFYTPNNSDPKYTYIYCPDSYIACYAAGVRLVTKVY